LSVRITSQENVVAWFDSTTGYAFGPIFNEEWEANDFLEHLSATDRDPRMMTNAQLSQEFDKWHDDLVSGE
jgi:hypothetical protein